MRPYLAVLFSIPMALVILAVAPGPEPAPIKVTAPTPEGLQSQLNEEDKQRRYDAAENVAAHIFQSNCHTDEWAEYAGHNAVDFNVPVRIVAALIVVESTCRAGVTSSEGAVGLMQIVPRVWHVNAEQLRDPEFNIRKGTEILSSYTRAHGLREGLHRYNGLGEGCDTCDSRYPDKVLLIAGYRQ